MKLKMLNRFHLKNKIVITIESNCTDLKNGNSFVDDNNTVFKIIAIGHDTF